jgi:hypothetical protein
VYATHGARDLADRLAAALDALATRMPLGPAPVGERAAARVHAAAAEWAPHARVAAGPGGTVIYDEDDTFRPSPGRRTIRVHPLGDPAVLPALVPGGAVECVGISGLDARPLLAALRDRGVARVCPVGRMQRPPLSWPRGQWPALGSLLGRRAPCELQVDP